MTNTHTAAVFLLIKQDDMIRSQASDLANHRVAGGRLRRTVHRVVLAGVNRHRIVVEDETEKSTFAASCGIPASMNVCGCGGGVPVTHLNWAFALDGGAIVSGGMPMGVKEAGSTEGVLLCAVLQWTSLERSVGLLMRTQPERD